MESEVMDIKQILIISMEVKEPDWYQTPDSKFHVRFMQYRTGIRSTVIETRDWDMIIVASEVVRQWDDDNVLDDYVAQIGAHSKKYEVL